MGVGTVKGGTIYPRLSQRYNTAASTSAKKYSGAMYLRRRRDHQRQKYRDFLIWRNAFGNNKITYAHHQEVSSAASDSTSVDGGAIL